MSSFSGSSFTTFLMFVPLAAIPLLAIFGIPEFSPVNASPSGNSNNPLTVSDHDPLSSKSKPKDAGDLFAPIESRTQNLNRFPSGSNDGQKNPFQTEPETANPFSGQTSSASPGLNGWTVDSTRKKQTSPGQSRFPEPQRPIQETRTEATRTAPQSFAEFAQSRQSTTGISTNQNTVANRKASQSPREITGTSRLTWKTAISRLNDLGIRDFRLQPGSKNGEFHFSCLFAPYAGSQIRHRFEAEDVQQLGAVKKVLDQIEIWQRRQK